MDLGKIFENNSDCYADTWITDENGNMGEGLVVMAMTKEKFIEVVNEIACGVNGSTSNDTALHKHIVSNPVKIMDWKYTETEKPLTYISGEWDGQNSDVVVGEDKNGKQYLVYYCEGFMDGSEFADWYETSGYLFDDEIVRWLPIPS